MWREVKSGDLFNTSTKATESTKKTLKMPSFPVPDCATIAPMFHSLYNPGNTSTATPSALSEKNADKTFLNWPASYLDGFQASNLDQWQLEIGGLVEKPLQFNLKDFTGFTRIQQNRRLVFADGYSFRANWEGFVVQELLHRVSPKPEAQYLLQTNLSGQVECVSLKELYSQRALFCLKVNGKNLPNTHGGPLRLLIFDRYAHKGIGQLCKLELVEEPIPGYMASKGYDPEAFIQPGNYYASDLKSMQTIKTPGEVTQW